MIYSNVDPTANIIFGALVDERMEGEMSITVLATGFQTQVWCGRRGSVQCAVWGVVCVVSSCRIVPWVWAGEGSLWFAVRAFEGGRQG